jgi:hypothetical protein
MKKISFILSAAILIANLHTQAQDAAESEKKEKPKASHKMNMIKINLTALPLKNYGFQYERVLSRKFSFLLGYRTMPQGVLPLQNTIVDLVADGDAETEKQIKDLTLGNTAITPEIRLYLSRKGYGRGFYVAPFYRNATFKAGGINIEYESTPTITKTMALSGKITGNTFGLQIGAQWNLGKYVCLDWFIIGPHIGTGKGELAGTSSQPLTATEQADLRQGLEDLDIPLSDKTVIVNANGATVKLDGPFAGVRAGISIGIKF